MLIFCKVAFFCLEKHYFETQLKEEKKMQNIRMLLKAEYKTRWKLESVLIIIISLIIVYNKNAQDSSHLLSACIICSAKHFLL